MGTVIAVICFIIGITVLLLGALIFTGLSIAGVIGSSIMAPAIILASALLLVGAFFIFMWWRNIQEKKILTVNVDGQNPSNAKTSAKKRVSITKILVIVVVALISVIAISAAVIDQLPNQMSSDTDTGIIVVNTNSSKSVTNTPSAGIIITMEDSDFKPADATVPLYDEIVWVNSEDDPPHTATSGTGSDDPNSGKIFDTDIINGGEQSTPLQLTSVNVGDEIHYYCMVHPSMTGKLFVT